jgi:predicted enzyme related to lactoylglutathione lyase
MAVATDGSISFYFFDVDDNLLFLSTRLYLWNAEEGVERALSSGEFATVQADLGRPGMWQAWAVRAETFRDFRDQPSLPPERQAFVRDVASAAQGTALWKGPSWPLLVHAAEMQRPIAIISARGHAPDTVRAGFEKLVSLGQLAAVPPILGIYTISNPDVQTAMGVTDAAMTIPSLKKIAIKTAVETALQKYGAQPPHRFGMSDDDPANVVLAVSAMRDCKLKHHDKRFFVINTNGKEFVKLEIFPMADPVTAPAGAHMLSSPQPSLPAGPSGARFEIGGAAVSVYISDMARAIRFYTEGLGLTLRTRIGDEWAEIATPDGFVIGLHPSHPNTCKPGTPGAINIELRAAGALDSAVESLTKHGVRFTSEIQNYEHVRLITCADPDGNELFLAQPLP